MESQYTAYLFELVVESLAVLHELLLLGTELLLDLLQLGLKFLLVHCQRLNLSFEDSHPLGGHNRSVRP